VTASDQQNARRVTVAALQKTTTQQFIILHVTDFQFNRTATFQGYLLTFA